MSKVKPIAGTKKRKHDSDDAVVKDAKRQRSLPLVTEQDDTTDTKISKSLRRRLRKFQQEQKLDNASEAVKASTSVTSGDAQSNKNLDTVDAHHTPQKKITVPTDLHGTPTTQLVRKSAGQQADDTDQSDKQPWAFDIARGGRYVDRDPVFLQRANGQELLVTAIGNQLRVLDIDTSSVVAILSAAVETEIISFDAVCTEEENLVRVLYSDGVLVDWDWTTNTADESRPAALDVDVYRLVALSERIASVFTSWNGRSCSILLDGRQIYRGYQRVLDLKILHGTSIIVAWCGDGFLLGKKQKQPGAEEYNWVQLPWNDSTCFDAYESLDLTQEQDVSLVVGHADGALLLYSSIASVFSKGELPTPQRLHWHRSTVSSVKFSRDGSYLISGGQETVLVLWQLATGKQSYLPNLTSAIARVVVSPVGDKYALQMGDNSIMVLSTSELKPVANFAGLQAADRTLAASLHPIDSDHILLTVAADIGGITRPFLQTYDYASDKHLSRQALTRNNVTDLNTGPDRQAIASPDVAHLAITADGQWLATIDKWTPPRRDLAHLGTNDSQEDKSSGREVYLKIWRWNRDSSEWMLNSRVDGPHGESLRSGDVFKLLSDPARPGFITTGEDSTIRVWRPQHRIRGGVRTGDVQWHCKSTIELERMEDRSDLELDEDVPTDAAMAISDDGSLLAVSMLSDNVIHFVDMDECRTKSSHNNIAGGDLLHLAFIDRYLVALSRRTLRLWDVVEDRLHWSKQLQDSTGALLAVSRLDNVVAVAGATTGFGAGAITIWDVQLAEVKCRLATEVPVTALLAQTDTKGFKVVFEDATIRTLSSMIALSSAQLAILAQDPANDAVIEDISSRPLIQSDAAMVTSSDKPVEDDRQVVRPEQLSRIFEVGNSATALPSVREMFHAVAGLFGRKSRI